MKKMFLLMLSVVVYALIACGCSSSALEAPQNVLITDGSTELTIAWDAVSGATSYNIYWSLDPNVTKTTGTKIESSTNSFIHTELRNATPVYYIVTALNGSDESDASDEATETPKFEGALETTFSVIEDTAFRSVLKLAPDNSGNVFLLLPPDLNNPGTSKIFKFDASGKKITSFGNKGSITFDPDDADNGCIAFGIDADSNGNIYVSGQCGYEQTLYNLQARVWKYTSDGIADTTFGNRKGYIDYNVSGTLNQIWALAQDIVVASDNNIVVSMSTTMSVGNKMIVLRISSTGELLSSVQQAMDYPAPLTFVTVDSNENIFVVAQLSDDEDEVNPRIWKFLRDGKTLDTTFNSTGIYNLTGFVRTAPPALDADGNLYLVGITNDDDNSIVWNIKLDTKGLPVSAFGNNGVKNLSDVCGSASKTSFIMISVTTVELGGDIVGTGLSATSDSDFTNGMCGVYGSSGLINKDLFTGGVGGDINGLFGSFATVDYLGRVVTANTITDFASVEGYQVLRYK